MKHLINFELKKIIKDKKTIFILSCLFIGLFLGFFFVRAEQKAAYEEETAELESRQYALGTEIQDYVDQDAFYGKESQAIQAVMSLIGDSVEQRKEGQVLASLESKAVYLKELRELKKLTGSEPLDEKTIERELLINEQFINKQIKPVYNEQGADGVTFMTTVFQYWTNWLGILVMISCLFNFWPSEYEKRTIRLMYTQPTNRRKQRLAKFLAAFIFCISLLASLLFLAFILGTVVNGVGSFAYPLSIEVDQTLRFIPLYSYFGQSLFLQILGMIALLSLMTFLSSLTSKASLVLALTLIISVGGTIVMESFVQGISYWPFSLTKSWQYIRTFGGIELAPTFWFASLSLLLFSTVCVLLTDKISESRSLS